MTALDCDAVLFDLDGVLVDSAECIARHWRRWAAGHGLDGDATLPLTHGMPTVDSIRLVAPHLEAEAEAARLDTWEACDAEGVVEIDGALLLVSPLPAGTWAIVTSCTRPTGTLRVRPAGRPKAGGGARALCGRRGRAIGHRRGARGGHAGRRGRHDVSTPRARGRDCDG